MIPCPGRRCQRATPDGLLCASSRPGERSCTGDLVRDLGQLPELMRQLMLTRTGQNRMGEAPRRSGTTALPVNLRAREVYDATINTIGTWIRVLDMGDLHMGFRTVSRVSLIRGTGLHVQHREPIPIPDTMAGWTSWLLARIERIRGHAAAPEIADTIGAHVLSIRREIDRPPDKIWFGPCPVCGSDLYARDLDQPTACRHCVRVLGREPIPYDPRPVRASMERHLLEGSATAPEILDVLPRLTGFPLRRQRWDYWLRMGWIVSTGEFSGGRLYPMRTAVELAKRDFERGVGQPRRRKL